MSDILHYQEYGKGPPIIILHGLFGSSTNWRSLSKSLSEHYRVITPDLRNHGRSSHYPSMNYSEMANDIANLMDTLSLQQSTLIGHSMGGKVAMVNALLHPDRVEKLVVLDIAPVNYDHRYGKIFHALNHLPLDQLKNRNEAEAFLNKHFDDLFLVRFLLQNLARNENGFVWRINLPAIQENIETISSFPDIVPAGTFNRPALFLGGEKSHFIQADHQRIIHKYFPGAEIEHIGNAGHMLHVEQPQEVLERTRLFLQG